MNGCVNFLLFSTLPNNQGAHCNSSGHLTQIEPGQTEPPHNLASETPAAHPYLTHEAGYLTHETGKQDNAQNLVLVAHVPPQNRFAQNYWIIMTFMVSLAITPPYRPELHSER